MGCQDFRFYSTLTLSSPFSFGEDRINFINEND